MSVVKVFFKLLFSTFGLFNCIYCGTHAMPLKIMKRNVGIQSGIEVPPPEIMKFMRRFGYLEKTSSDSESLYHESAIVEAVKNIQKYGALNQTGKLDNETLNLLTKPRCGVPDIEATPYYLISSTQKTSRRINRAKRYVVGARTWTKRKIKYFFANWSLKIPRVQIERDIKRAFALWSSYSGLIFEYVNNTAADIIVGFGSYYHGDNYPFDGPGNILAHAFYPYELGSWGGDVHFDENENWKENSTDLANGVDFFAVAAHEIGHSLGLAHSPSYTSIMFPYYKGPDYATLGHDDTLAMYEMYLSKKLDGDYIDESVSTNIIEVAVDTSTTANTELDMDSDFNTPSTCEGDCVTIERHQQNFVPFRTVTYAQTETATSALVHSELSPVPNICDGHFNAVSLINGSVHIFKNEYVWKLTEHYTVAHGYPLSIYELFPFLPNEVKQIDAAYGRYDGATVFFIDAFYWVFRGANVLENSPKPLSNLIGLDYSVNRVDAAMMWPKNNLTYIFAGEKFWRYDDRLQIIDFGYPKSMQRWPGIPNNIDAAATLTNGKTYFFKDNIYWLYNNRYVRPERGYPRRASTAWLSCAAPKKTRLRNFNTTVSFI